VSAERHRGERREEIETDRQTNRQTDRQTVTDRQSEREPQAAAAQPVCVRARYVCIVRDSVFFTWGGIKGNACEREGC
jgi:hypothetical protein